MASGTFFESKNVKMLASTDFVRGRGEKVLPNFKRGAVLYFAPWCHHCKLMKTDWSKFADGMSKKVPGFLVAAVNCDEHGDIATALGLEGFPTIVFYDAGAGKEYNGERSSDELIAFAMNLSVPPSRGLETISKAGFFNASSKVIELSDKHFNLGKRTLTGVQAPIAVLFYAPWCHWCKASKPEWEKVASLGIKGLTVAALDCAAFPLVGDALGIDAYPTIKMFKTASLESAVSFHDERTVAAITSFIKKQMPTNDLDKKQAQNVTQQGKPVSAGPHLVMFYRATDSVAQSYRTGLLPRLANKFQRYARIGAISCEKKEAACSKLQVGQAPVFVLFNEGSALRYTGPIAFDSMAEFVYDRLVGPMGSMPTSR
jgi:thioredoxin-like negative regulator of GroEL